MSLKSGQGMLNGERVEWRWGRYDWGEGGGGEEKYSDSLDPNNTGLTVDRQVLKKRKGRCITRPQEE